MFREILRRVGDWFVCYTISHTTTCADSSPSSSGLLSWLYLGLSPLAAETDVLLRYRL